MSCCVEISTTISYQFAITPFGEVLVAATRKGVCDLVFVDGKKDTLVALRKRHMECALKQASTPMIRNALKKFNSRHASRTVVPIDLQGTLFQQHVWKALQRIPHGAVTTYGAIAKQIGRPQAVRAVGTAVGANPVAVLVPCHRVIASDGKVGAYRWGSIRKAALLLWEQNHSKSLRG